MKVYRVVLVLGVLIAAIAYADTVLVPATPGEGFYVKLKTGETVPAMLMLTSDGDGNFFYPAGSTSYPKALRQSQ